jgi:hypothetical protein
MFLLAFKMRNIMKIAPAAASVCLLILSACAGREPSLPTIALASDQSQECTALEAEVIANAIGIAGGLLFWPALFAIDTKNADGHEGNALIDRNEHLKQIALKKGCDASGYPTVVKYQ